MEGAHTSSSSSSTAQIAREGRKTDLVHSVRKPVYKAWRKPVAQQVPPNPTRVYKVKPVEFKDVVQKLTGAPEFQASRLQSVAPAPLDLNLGGIVRLLPGNMQLLKSEESNGMGFDLSPSSNAWCTFLLLSPRNMSGFDQSTVL